MMLNNVARVTGSIDAIGLGGRVDPGVSRRRRPADRPGRTDAGRRGRLAAGDVRVSPHDQGPPHLHRPRRRRSTSEKIVENNQRSAVATVVEAGIRVLYIEGTLRAEYGALVDRFLAKDPDLEFCALVQTRPNVFLQRTNMSDLRLAAIPTDQETIDKFDVFIFGDIDSSYIRPAAAGDVRQADSRGGGPGHAGRLSQPRAGRLRAARRWATPCRWSSAAAKSANSPSRSCRC